jgi:hypothetical protein
MDAAITSAPASATVTGAGPVVSLCVINGITYIWLLKKKYFCFNPGDCRKFVLLE